MKISMQTSYRMNQGLLESYLSVQLYDEEKALSPEFRTLEELTDYFVEQAMCDRTTAEKICRDAGKAFKESPHAPQP